MSSYRPRHRTPAHQRVLHRLARSGAAIGGTAAVATGIAVGGALLSGSAPATNASAALSSASQAQQPLSRSELAQREERASRSEGDRRPVTDVAKARTLSNASGPARTRTVDLSEQDPRDIAKALMPQFGMSVSDFGCIDAIWTQESGWNIHADNPTSSAYGIPQALPGSKMSSAGPDWQNNPVTQIKWGLGYIKSRYGTPCAAAGVKRAQGWY